MSSMGFGRPSKYKPEFCARLLEHCAGGLSIESFAGRIGVCTDTVFHWANVHPDFSDAIKKGRAMSQLWWEETGISGMKNEIPFFSAAIWIFNMKNRFRWRDAIEIGTPAGNVPAKVGIPFAEFCEKAGYPIPYPKQIEMTEFVVQEDDEPRLLLGSRGYGKTDYCVVLGLAHCLYLDALSKKPEFSCLLITKSEERNGAVLEEIAKACMANGMKLEKQNASAIRIAGLLGKDHSVSATTVGTSSLRGRHPKLVIMEDVVTPEDDKPATRRKVQRVYNEVSKLVQNVCLVGQPVHKFDLYETLRPKLKKMEVPHGSIPELDVDLEAQRLAGVSEDSIQASYFLKTATDSEFPLEACKFIDTFPVGDSVAFIDPSFEGGDYTALSIFRSHFDGVAVQGHLFKRAWNHCLDDMVKRMIQCRVKKVCFETNSLGDQPVLMLRQALDGVGVIGKKSTTNKHSRILSASPYAKLIHLARTSDPLYIEQVTKYEYGAEHDDGPDSLATGLEWIGLIRGKTK